MLGLAAVATVAVAACSANAPTAGDTDTSTTAVITSSSTVDNSTGDSTPDTTSAPDNPSSPTSTTVAGDPVAPEDLDPDTAVVIVEGQVLYFAVGTEFANICNVQPSIGFGDVKMHYIDGDFSGEPNLHAQLVADPSFLIVQIAPDVGYIAGSGVNVEPYVEHFGVTPPPVTVTAAEGGFVGDVDLVNVFTGEIVDSRWVIACDLGAAGG